MPIRAAKSLTISISGIHGCCTRFPPSKSVGDFRNSGSLFPFVALHSKGEEEKRGFKESCSLRALCNSHILTSVLRFHTNLSQLSSTFFKSVTTPAPGNFLSENFEFDGPGISSSPASLGLSNMAQRIMDTQSSRSPCVSLSCLSSMEKMTEWLEERLPSGNQIVRSWGSVPGTKCVSNLWTEFMTGEISLEDSSPPKRTVEVVSIRIVDDHSRVLIESHQMLSDGSLRVRNRPLSEKMKPGETVEDASFRGIEEELGPVLGARTNVTLDFETYKLEIQERESFSYPGLLSHYIVHHLNARVQNLPQVDFTTVEEEGPNIQLLICQNAIANRDSKGSDGFHSSDTRATTNAEMDTIPSKQPVGVKVHYWSWKTES